MSSVRRTATPASTLPTVREMSILSLCNTEEEPRSPSNSGRDKQFLCGLPKDARLINSSREFVISRQINRHDRIAHKILYLYTYRVCALKDGHSEASILESVLNVYVNYSLCKSNDQLLVATSDDLYLSLPARFTLVSLQDMYKYIPEELSSVFKFRLNSVTQNRL